MAKAYKVDFKIQEVEVSDTDIQNRKTQFRSFNLDNAQLETTEYIMLRVVQPDATTRLYLVKNPVFNKPKSLTPGEVDVFDELLKLCGRTAESIFNLGFTTGFNTRT